MNNTTTHETSKALIAAGFPVTRPEVGQFWYATNGDWFLVYAVNEDRADIISESGQTWINRFLNDGDMVPAFTAVDILRVLGELFSIEFRLKERVWFCIDYTETLNPQAFQSENPAEGAARAFLFKHKEKAVIEVKLGQVYQHVVNRVKFVVVPRNIEEIKANPMIYSFVCEKPHEDKDYSYVCWKDWCGCMD